MNPVGSLFGTTIGRKLLMAGTGAFMLLFVAGHLVGNLQIFEDPDKINGYAYFLHSLGPTLWVLRLVLLACVVIHVWAATALAVTDYRARGAVRYQVNTWLQASMQSRYMRSTGYVVLAFLIYHLAHFTIGVAQSATFKENLPPYVMAADYRIFGLTVVRSGTSVPDVHSMVIRGFQNTPVALFYIVAVGLLSLHLLHGADSIFQTLGWRNSRWSGTLRKVVAGLCLLYFLGNLAIPGSVLIGAKVPREVPAAAR